MTCLMMLEMNEDRHPRLSIQIDDVGFEGWKQRSSYVSRLLDPFRKLQGLGRIEIIWDTSNEPEFDLDFVLGDRIDTPVDIMKEVEKYLERIGEAEKWGKWELIIEEGVAALNTIRASRNITLFRWAVMEGGMFDGVLTFQ